MTEKQKNKLFKGFLTGKSIRVLVLLPAFLTLLILSSNTVNAASSPIYRFWSQKNTAYFYTASIAERDGVRRKYTDYQWKYQGAKFEAFKTQEAGTSPVYRFWSKKNQTHFYTITKAERDKLRSEYTDYQWKYGGEAFYAYKTSDTGRTPVYRFWSKELGTHYYTTSPGEKNCMLNNFSDYEWRYSGVVFWVPEEGADLSTDEDTCDMRNGPDIKVGLWSYSKSGIRDDPFRIEANKTYRIEDGDGNKLGQVSGGTITKVKYDGDGKLKVYDSISPVLVDQEVIFKAADGKSSNMVFDAHKPNSSNDEYRGKIKVRYSDSSKTIWIINILPLEQYIWGIGEITGTGDRDYNRVMTTAFRTYGYWKILYSTKYASEGFHVVPTASNQIYSGYEHEIAYPRIKEAAQYTKGRIAKHGSDIALTPYSSWTDGRTRSFEERWGSDNYPWCQSVSDPYGDYNGSHWDNSSYRSTADLVAGGNHMVGISAHGALDLAGDHGWSWSKILKYYLSGISIAKIY